jgi:hypothetical protein
LVFIHTLDGAYELLLEVFSAHWTFKFFEKPLSDAFLMEHMRWGFDKRRGRFNICIVAIERLEALTFFEWAKANAARLKSLIIFDFRLNNVNILLLC